MKVKVISEKRSIAGDLYTGDLLDDKIYDVLEVSKHGFYRILDESGEDYLYPPNMFEIVEE